MGGCSSDNQFAVIKAFGGVWCETYKDRRAMVEEQIRLLFVDLMFQSGKSHEGDAADISTLGDELAAAVRRIGQETLDDWHKKFESEEDEGD